jgi:hypothetical protein
MLRYITAIRVSQPATHSNITHVSWVEPQTNNSGTSTVETVVNWLKTAGNQAFVKGTQNIAVTVVDAKPPYLRTVANGILTDNLLSLPRF